MATKICTCYCNRCKSHFHCWNGDSCPVEENPMQLIVVGELDQVYTFSCLVPNATYDPEYLEKLLKNTPDFLPETDSILEMFVVPGGSFQHFYKKE